MMNQYEPDEFEPSNITTRVRDKLVVRLENFARRMEKLAPNYMTRPQTIPPRKLEELDITEIAQLAVKYGHNPALGLACDCVICRAISKIVRRG